MQTRLAEAHPFDRPNRLMAGGFGLIALGAVIAVTSALSHLPLVLLGAVMAGGGALTFVEARAKRNGQRDRLEELSASVIFALGVLFVLWPFSGLFLLTPLLLAFFLFDGVLLVINALTIRDEVWKAELATGAVTILLGLLIALHWRPTAIDFAATLAGIHLASRGFMFIAASFAARRGLCAGAPV